MNEKIYKFSEYIRENMKDTPEHYVENALMKIKSKIEKMFNFDDSDVKKYGSGDTSLKDMGVEMQSLELSKYSKIYDNVKLIFSDEKFRYDMTITIDLKDASDISQNAGEDKDFSDEDIDKCYIKFKKYDMDTDNFTMIGSISKTVKISEIDEQLLIDLKMEVDDEYGDDDEEFEIETEED